MKKKQQHKKENNFEQKSLKNKEVRSLREFKRCAICTNRIVNFVEKQKEEKWNDSKLRNVIFQII